MTDVDGADAGGFLRRRGLTLPILGVLVLALMGFGQESILRAVVSVMILDRGGDSVLVGLAAAVYALPSIVFRPVIGALIDRWDHGSILRLGTFFSASLTLFLLLPGLLAIFVVRFLHGVAWSFHVVAIHVLMAKRAPAHQRGAVSGYFMAMPALATLIGPGLGVAAYALTGEVLPLVMATALGSVGFLVASRTRVPRAVAPPEKADQDAATPERWLHRFLEPSALPATVMVAAFMAAHALFIVFPPVYALAIGAPLDAVAVSYVVYGLSMTASQFLGGGVSDRLGRATTIRIGCTFACIGLLIPILFSGMVAFIVASMFYAIAVSLVSPTISALTIDRAREGRLGAAIATYTLGYQVATGLSSAAWGAIVAIFGFPVPFIVAIALQLVTIAMSLRYAGPGRTRVVAVE